MIDKYIKTISAATDSQVISIDTGLDTSIALRVYQAIKYIPDNKDFFLLNSDTLFEFDIDDMYKLHKKSNALITLSSVDVVSSWGLILVKDNKVTGFERQRKVRHLFSNNREKVEGLVYSGFSWINKKAVNNINLKTCGISEGGRGMETSLFQSAIDMGRISHYSINGLWFPIDTPKDFQIINMMIDDRHSFGHAAKEYKEKLRKSGK
jgi:NDP-sugar pyrophosphorylase family protein